MRSWFVGDDDRPGLDVDEPFERLEDFRCAKCGQPLERVSIAVPVEPFNAPLLACSETCAADLQAELR